MPRPPIHLYRYRKTGKLGRGPRGYGHGSPDGEEAPVRPKNQQPPWEGTDPVAATRENKQASYAGGAALGSWCGNQHNTHCRLCLPKGGGTGTWHHDCGRGGQIALCGMLPGRDTEGRSVMPVVESALGADGVAPQATPPQHSRAC